MKTQKNIDVSVIMGSQSDWETMKHSSEILKDFKISHENKIVSAHRTPERLYNFAKLAQKKKVKIIIAGAGGSAHLPGMVASMTSLPVLGVPMESKLLNGLDSLFSIVQMPFGVPTATFAVGKAGAKNAALFAVSILSLNNKVLLKKLSAWREMQTNNIKTNPV